MNIEDTPAIQPNPDEGPNKASDITPAANLEKDTTDGSLSRRKVLYGLGLAGLAGSAAAASGAGALKSRILEQIQNEISAANSRRGDSGSSSPAFDYTKGTYGKSPHEGQYTKGTYTKTLYTKMP